MLLEEGITPEKQTKEEGRNRKTRLFGKSMGRGPPKRKRKRLRQTLLSRQQQQLAENESSPSLSLSWPVLALRPRRPSDALCKSPPPPPPPPPVVGHCCKVVPQGAKEKGRG